jgi:hypothetical protein
MKKRLEAELISIAHRILKLKNKSELTQLHSEAQKLYETLSVLMFVENNLNIIQPKIDIVDLEEKLEIAFDHNAVTASNETNLIEENTNHLVEEELVSEINLEVQEEIAEASSNDTQEDIPAIKKEIINKFDPLFELSTEEPEKITEQKSPKQLFEDLLGHDYNNLTFEKVNASKTEVVELSYSEESDGSSKTTAFFSVETKAEEIIEPVEAETEKVVHEAPPTQLENPSRTISFGLNDRIGFEKQLFGNSAEDMNRVISQLNTFDTYDEAAEFITEMVKPDYNDWSGKEDYEARFMEIVAKKFS